ncbi:MAG: UDP-N-acetylglucosamine 2-epimerase (non-hydrolyzing) [Cyanobacteria bacterium P01_A01_bin.84]
MKIVTILGARPQFIKASVVSQAFIDAGIEEVIVHTGQHFDSFMSEIFFQDLNIPNPQYHLDIHSLNHGAMTGRMMEKIEDLLLAEKPNWVCVYGDTNSTLAGALVAAKLHIPLAHIEAGLRSYNQKMPEEINRVVTDHISQLLFVPTSIAIECLQKEGIFNCIHLVGDVMKDAVLTYQKKAEQTSKILEKYQLNSGKFYLATIHRPSNTDNINRLKTILESFASLDYPVVFPIHPRTEAQIKKLNLQDTLEGGKIIRIPPVSYLDMLTLEDNAKAVITDSGGMQKEAYILSTPCFTVRDETEWRETVDIGWNTLVQPENLNASIQKFIQPPQKPSLYGIGDAAQQIAQIISCSC